MTMRFGFELRKVRDELRLTQQQAAVLLDLSPATIANWELGRVSKINAVLRRNLGGFEDVGSCASIQEDLCQSAGYGGVYLQSRD